MQPIRTGFDDFKAYSNDVTYQYTEITTVSDAKRRFRVRQYPVFFVWETEDLQYRKSWIRERYKNSDIECDPFQEHAWPDAPQEDDGGLWYSTMEADGSWTTPNPLCENNSIHTDKRHDDLSKNRILMFISAILLTLFIITTQSIGASI